MSTHVSRVWWSRAVAASVASLLSLSLVAGCADDSGKVEAAAPEPAPAEVEETPETEPVKVTTIEDIVISEKGPTVPELGSAEGAKEAVQLFMVVLQEGMKSKQIAGIEAISDPECVGCKHYMAVIQNMNALGYEMPTNTRWEFSDMLAYPIKEPAGSYAVLVRIDTYEWPDSGEIYEGREGVPETTIGEPLAFVVRPLEAQWIVQDILLYEEAEFTKLWDDMQGFGE